MPQSIGPFNNFITRKVAKGIVEKSDKVFVRDICSKDLLKIDLKIKKDINVVTDLSFYMYRDENISMDRFIDGGKKVIGININAALYNKDDEDFRYSYAKIIEKVIRKFAITEEAEILLVPHVDSVDNCDEDDFKVCRELAYNMSKSIGKNIKSIGFDYSSEEIKGIISKCEFFIGSRLYPCIDSISSKVPTIFLAYNSNYVDMFNYFNLNEFVYDISDGIGDNLLDEIINRYKEKNKMIDKLTNIVPELKKQLVSIS